MQGHPVLTPLGLRTRSVVRRITVPRKLLLVAVLSSWDVSTVTVRQSNRGGRPRRGSSR